LAFSNAYQLGVHFAEYKNSSMCENWLSFDTFALFSLGHTIKIDVCHTTGGFLEVSILFADEMIIESTLVCQLYERSEN
jgi:hypothetical protein